MKINYKRKSRSIRNPKNSQNLESRKSVRAWGTSKQKDLWNRRLSTLEWKSEGVMNKTNVYWNDGSQEPGLVKHKVHPMNSKSIWYNKTITPWNLKIAVYYYWDSSCMSNSRLQWGVSSFTAVVTTQVCTCVCPRMLKMLTDASACISAAIAVLSIVQNTR